MPVKKSRCFTIIAYEEDPRFNDIMNVIKDKAPSWAYIMHDKDVDDDKELKKPHFHFVVYFDNALNIDGVFRKFDGIIPQNYIQYHDNLRRAIRYLPHLDTPTKFQYLVESVVSNFDVSRYLSVKVNEDKEIFEILEKIEIGEIRTYYDLYHCGASWSVIRRNFNMLKSYMFDSRFSRGFGPRKTPERERLEAQIEYIHGVLLAQEIDSLFDEFDK